MSTEDNATLSKLSDTGKTVADTDVDVRGLTVTDKNGKDIGTVEDLLIDDRERRVRFLLVEHGGILGLDETKSFIPVDAITRITGTHVHIDHTADHVVEAPRYDPQLMNDRTYNRSVYGHYGYAPFWEAAYAHPYYPMSLPHA
jgi:sporulation protein YlmC with PRC-barrel domain